MNTHIYRFELHTHLRSVLTWSFAVVILMLLFMSLFPGFADQALLMNQIMERFPVQLRDAFGLANLDLSSTLGYFSFLFVFVQLCLAIQASNYGFGLVSIEDTELTADFLLSKPISRAEVLTSKLLAVLTSLVLTDLVVWLSSFTTIWLFSGTNPYEMKAMLLLLLSIIPFQLFFLCVGLVISLLVRRVYSVTPYALGLSFGMYIMSAFTGIFDEVMLEYITPFKHFDTAFIVKNTSYDMPLLLLNIAISGLCLGLSYWCYIQRDVPAVT